MTQNSYSPFLENQFPNVSFENLIPFSDSKLQTQTSNLHAISCPICGEKYMPVTLDISNLFTTKRMPKGASQLIFNKLERKILTEYNEQKMDELNEIEESLLLKKYKNEMTLMESIMLEHVQKEKNKLLGIGDSSEELSILIQKFDEMLDQGNKLLKKIDKWIGEME